MKYVYVFLAFLILSAFTYPLSGSASVSEFNEYGMKHVNLESLEGEWTEIPSKTNVPLDKTWTVKFTKSMTLEDIDAITIERNKELIPIFISLKSNDEIIGPNPIPGPR